MPTPWSEFLRGCYAYVGFGIAIEALRDCWIERDFSTDELFAMALVCRVHVFRSYLESLT